MVDNEPVSDIDTVQLPPASSALEGTWSTPVAMGTSFIFDNENHIFKTWAVPAKDLQGVREGLNEALNSGLAAASHVPYAFRFREADGKIVENFDSNADNGMGLRILKTLKANQALNVAVYVGHRDTGGTTQQAVKEALEVPGRNINPEKWIDILNRKTHRFWYILLRG